MNKLRQWITWGVMALFVWVVTACLWYAVHRWIVRLPGSSFLLTFLSIPGLLVVQRWISRSRWLARISGSRFVQKIQPLLNFIGRALTVCLITGFFFLVISRLVTTLGTRAYTFDLTGVPAQRVAIVFGAGILPDGRLTPFLRERVETASELYFDGKVEKLLMSGDNRFVNYNEPAAMRAYALSLGVPDEAIVLDYAGRSTYDTCYRANVIFGVKDAILVTQEYHLPRAVYTCRTLGIDAKGVAARNRIYRTFPRMFDNVRESLATLNALWELYVSHPVPVLGDPEPIFSSSGG